jgi:hypothetical protein
MTNKTIPELPPASALIGTEQVPIQQNGLTVQTTVSAIANSPTQYQTFLTANQETTLANSRRLVGGLGIGESAGSPQGQFSVFLNGVSASLETVSQGIIVKNSSTGVTNRSIAITGGGMSVTNADGISGNPTLGLTGLPLALSSVGGTGFLTVVGGSTLGTSVITGTTNQISVSGGDGSSTPTISIATDPIVPGAGSITIPNGTTGQRAGSTGAIRYNSSLGAFEGYLSTGWQQFSSAGGVTSFQTSLSGLTPSSPTTGVVTLAGTLNPSSGGTGAVSLSGYVIGNGTSPFTASATIPTTDLSGTITNAQLANSSITINSNTVSLGGSVNVGTVTSVTGTSPIASSGGTTPAISISQATTSTNGYLSSTDWNTFNNKGSGSVTSVAATVPAFLSVSGSPITTSGTLALTYSGTALPVANGGTARTVGNYSVFANEIHVSKDGNDTTGDGTLINPVLTITKALTLIAGLKKTVIVHAGDYPESPTVSTANTTIATSELTGANTTISGTLTLSAAARVSGIKISNLAITGSGSTYISNCTVDTQVVKSGTNYVEIINTELQCVSGVQITGAGTVSIVGNKCWAVAVSNASANVLIKDCFQVLTPSVTAGNLQIDGSAIFAASPASNAVTSSVGSFITLANSFILNSAGTNVERVSLAGFYSILNLVYDKTNSTFTGTNLNAIDYFSVINADTLVLTNDLAIAYGGTNSSATPTAGAVPYGTGTAYAFSAAGTAGQVLTSQGAGTPTWTTPTTGTVTSVTGTAPVVSSGGNTPAISMAAANTTTNGYLTSTDWNTFNGKGSGSVTSVAQSFTGGLISVAGSPITTSGTLALTVAGTSGGIPYFSSATTWATSAALAANALMIGGGAGVAPSTITTGTGVTTALGVNVGSAGAFVTFNGALGTPSSGTVTNLTGTASININGTVGATTPTTGNFTTVTATTGIFGGGF